MQNHVGIKPPVITERLVTLEVLQVRFLPGLLYRLLIAGLQLCFDDQAADCDTLDECRSASA